MLIDVAHTRLLLQRGQTSRLPQAGAIQLCSAAGTVWITLDHDLRDIVLEPGQCFATPGDRGVTSDSCRSKSSTKEAGAPG